jgi:hypothetical protein
VPREAAPIEPTLSYIAWKDKLRLGIGFRLNGTPDPDFVKLCGQIGSGATWPPDFQDTIQSCAQIRTCAIGGKVATFEAMEMGRKMGFGCFSCTTLEFDKNMV